jgi:hypothetical protein
MRLACVGAACLRSGAARLVRAAAPASAETPAPLACLERLYAARAVQRDGRWSLVLPDGSALPWDDGRRKSFAERLEAPDVKDAFALRYRAGAIRPVRAVDEDPGRIRLDALLRATYPQGGLTRVRLFGRMLTVHRKVAGAFARVAARLERARADDTRLGPFLDELGGTFAARSVAGTDRPSAHAYGIALDLNPARTHYWRWQKPKTPITWQSTVPQSIVDAFESEGFIWGGRWYHYDTMHFEYRPELLDARCYE